MAQESYPARLRLDPRVVATAAAEAIALLDALSLRLDNLLYAVEVLDRRPSLGEALIGVLRGPTFGQARRRINELAMAAERR